MNALRKGPSPNLAIQHAISRLKDAEVNLLVAVRTRRHPHNALLLASLALLREALATVSRAPRHNKSRGRTKRTSGSSQQGARLL
jgi:hypothetical protein